MGSKMTDDETLDACAALATHLSELSSMTVMLDLKRGMI
jgi:hypothetical protein